MALVWLRVRSEWRRRWPSLLALTFLVALVGSVVLTTVAGARRTRTSVERFKSTTRASDTFIVFKVGATDAAKRVAILPEVATAAQFAAVSFVNTRGYVPALASVDGKAGTTVARDLVVRGRRADQSAPREVTLSEPVARRYGLTVGGSLQVTGMSKDQGRCAATDDPSCAEFLQKVFGSPPDFSVLAGPTVTLRVVGVTRGLDNVVARPGDVGVLLLTRAFFEQYGSRGYTQPGLAVRLRSGVTQRQFENAVARSIPKDTILDLSDATASVTDAVQSTVGVLANGLLVFAGVAALAGLVAITQALARQTAAGSRERSVLRSLGASSRTRRLDALAPAIPVALGGAALAIVGAWFGSRFMPIGTARRLEPRADWHFDVAVLLVGGLAVVAVTLLATGLSAWWTERRSGARPAPPSKHRELVGSSVVATIGLRFARDRGHGTRTVPVRSAVAGIAAGVAGLIAVSTFAAGQHRLESNPRRFGWAWEIAIGSGQAGDSGQTRARIEQDPGVERAIPVWLGYQARVAGRSITAFAQRPQDGDGFVVIRGRAPRSASEAALGAKTMRRAHAGIGDTVDVEGHRARVVGQAIFPVGNDVYPLADGVLLSKNGFELRRVEQSSSNTGYRILAVRLRHAADPRAVLARLRKLQTDDNPLIARTPPEVDQLRQLDRLPVLLAGFLTLVALIALTHALVLTMRRRTHELALLRAIGFTAAQTKGAVAWQASALSIGGIVIGVPLGAILGRWVWALVADAYGVATDPAWPWGVLAFVVPVTLVVVNLIAWPLARRAARVRPARILRTE